MYACLSLEITEGICTAHPYSGTLDSALILQEVEDFTLEAVALTPSEVHSEEHVGPVAGLRTARTGVNREEHVVLVEFTVQQGLELKRSVGRIDLVDLGAELCFKIGILLTGV